MRAKIKKKKAAAEAAEVAEAKAIKAGDKRKHSDSSSATSSSHEEEGADNAEEGPEIAEWIALVRSSHEAGMMPVFDVESVGAGDGLGKPPNNRRGQSSHRQRRRRPSNRRRGIDSDAAAAASSPSGDADDRLTHPRIQLVRLAQVGRAREMVNRRNTNGSLDLGCPSRWVSAATGNDADGMRLPCFTPNGWTKVDNLLEWISAVSSLSSSLPPPPPTSQLKQRVRAVQLCRHCLKGWRAISGAEEFVPIHADLCR